jgi:CelD/BcsL family acetyltransferase involved in cellulose biosynthesis/RimJ/RimL family protein N-acetyltransferase
MTAVTQVTITHGQSALSMLADYRFLTLWNSLYDACPHATVFQSPNFVRTWYETYQSEWQPVIVESRDSNGDFIGLWLLAHNPVSNTLAHAGTHQAEYHTWLASPGHDTSFLSNAWDALNRHFTVPMLRFKYLPTRALGEILCAALGNRSCGITLRTHGRPLMNLIPEDIKASFGKKSNKSRFSRLRKLGKLEFRCLRTAAELEAVLDDLIVYYDFRQSAVNHSAPFREDHRKRVFHNRLFHAMPDGRYVTATYLDERPIAAFWGSASQKTVHLGMLIHSPFLAEHSPGKLHIMQLSEYLLEHGITVLDLTPGGDSWKERFANAHDEVAEAVVYGSTWTHIRAMATESLLRRGKQVVFLAGIQPTAVKTFLETFRRARPGSVIRKLKNWYSARREFRIYRGDRLLSERFSSDNRIHCNSLSDLLAFEPGEPWQTRDNFLSSALTRLEQGEFVYTIEIGNRLAHCGWMVKHQATSYMTEVKQAMTFPPGSVALYDYYTPPCFRGQGLYRATIGHMMHAAFADEQIQYAYISVLADNLPSLHVIESMGFEYQGSLFWDRRFGRERTWSHPPLKQG